jgi:ubiquitin C-terminal hydrolase
MTDSLEKYNGYGKVGLNNRGNTCFLNTTLQCLSNVIPLTNYILRNEFLAPLKSEKKKTEIRNKLGKEFEITKAYVQLMKVLWNSEEAIDPRTFHTAFQQFDDRFAGFQQQDAEEALIIIMDSIHEVLSYSVQVNITGEQETDMDTWMIEAFREWKRINENKYSIITDIFTGQFVNQIICKEVENRNEVLSRTYENFDRIHVPIHGNTLYDCFYHYFNVELLDTKYHDEKRDMKVKAGRQIKMMLLPKYLIVVLKRFQNDGIKFTKKNTMVSFPLDDLDMSNYTMGYDRYKAKYRLRSIGCHVGGIQGGHYYAICRHRDNKWYMFNDRQCEEYNIKGDIPMLQTRAYMLIYEKKE